MLVVDASVALKWVLSEADSHLARALVEGDEEPVLPDFWLHEASNICWPQVRKRFWSAAEAKRAFQDLVELVPARATADPGLHDVALDLALTVEHSPYDMMYVAFALSVGARAVVASDAPFTRAIRRHPDRAVAGLALTLDEWARERGLA